jgi:glucokinase
VTAGGEEGHGGGDDVVVAVDVGGTAIKGLAVRRDRRVIRRARVRTRADQGQDRVIARIADVCAELVGDVLDADSRPPAALGVALPGVVDEAAGVGRFSANLGWRNAPVGELLRKRFDLPVAVCHDVRAAGLAEGRLGAATGALDFLLVQIGTGIAGALVLGGRPYAGAHGLGGELGHIIVDPQGPQCGCGGRGCLETIASAAAIARRYGERSNTRRADAAAVVARVRAGDLVAGQVWAEAVDALAIVLATYQNTLDPELVVIGGGLAGASGALLGPLGRALEARLSFQHQPDLAVSPLGADAGCLGAAIIARSAAASPAASQASAT